MGKSIFADAPALYGHGQILLGTVAAIASGGANARPGAVGFVAHHDMRILSAWKHNLSAAEVTVGTATSSASYRRHMIRNGGSAGTATTIVASLNATSSAASLGSRAFTVDSTLTVSRGDVVYYDQITVGAATADGTDSAACALQVCYQLL
jgi:hypothetical protein